MKKFYLIIFILLIYYIPAYPQSYISISAAPGAVFPLGPEYSTDIPYFSTGGCGELEIAYPLPFADFIYIGVSAAYSLMPIYGAEEVLHLVDGGALAGISFDLNSKFNIAVQGEGGYWRGFRPAGSDGSFWAGGSASFTYQLSRTFGIFLTGGYKYNFYNDGSIMNGVFTGIGTRFKLIPDDINIYLKQGEFEIRPVFPVFYSYYNSNPLGELILVNEEDGDIADLEVTFYNEQFMDSPRICISEKQLSAGEDILIPLYALFNDSVLEITEGTVVSCLVNVSYSFEGKSKNFEISKPVTLNNRNAMTWDDDRKAASFVTAKDPEILKFARNTAGVERVYKSSAISRNFRIAVAISEAVAAYGVTYIRDPSTPFVETSSDETAVDYLQFPYQTLSYRAGDCDDLTILYSALLEAAGVETAFVTVPGHIFAAFNPGLSIDEAKSLFPKGQYVESGGRVWLPVEITVLDKGFQQAWQKGTAQWNEHSDSGNAALLPVRDSWQLYQPVAIRSASEEISISFLNGFESQYSRSLERVISRIIAPEEDRLKKRIQQNQGDRKQLNRLGVLYARFGRYDDAAEVFGQIDAAKYPAVYANLANLAFAGGDYEAARAYYSKALDRRTGKYRAMLNLSQLEYDSGNFKEADRLYSIVSMEKPRLTGGFEFLSLDSDDVSRAEGDAGSQLLWIEEEDDE